MIKFEHCCEFIVILQLLFSFLSLLSLLLVWFSCFQLVSFRKMCLSYCSWSAWREIQLGGNGAVFSRVTWSRPTTSRGWLLFHHGCKWLGICFGHDSVGAFFIDQVKVQWTQGMVSNGLLFNGTLVDELFQA